MDELLDDLDYMAPRVEKVIARLQRRVEELEEEGAGEEKIERHRSALGLLEDLQSSLTDVLEVLPSADLDV